MRFIALVAIPVLGVVATLGARLGERLSRSLVPTRNRRLTAEQHQVILSRRTRRMTLVGWVIAVAVGIVLVVIA